MYLQLFKLFRVKNVSIETRRSVFFNNRNKIKPTSSDVLTSYLLQSNEPPWTSYFVKVCIKAYIIILLKYTYALFIV